MQTLRISLLAAAAALAASTLATPAVAADTSLAFNIGAVTEYRYRGISQTRLKPALQGGLDYTAGSFYVGAWGSTIQWIKDSKGGADVEIDIYGGYKFELAKGTVLDLGVLTYQYPSNGLKPSANTTEVYGALTVGPVTAKYSHSTSNLFGFDKSKGSGYLDISGSFEVAGITVTPHVGRQTVKNTGSASYTDYSLTLSKEISGVTWSAALVDTNTKAYTGPGGKDLGKASIVLGAKYGF
ncbi:MAG: TorF family putative porin [Rubrivivax sp.]